MPTNQPASYEEPPQPKAPPEPTFMDGVLVGSVFTAVFAFAILVVFCGGVK